MTQRKNVDDLSHLNLQSVVFYDLIILGSDAKVWKHPKLSLIPTDMLKLFAGDDKILSLLNITLSCETVVYLGALKPAMFYLFAGHAGSGTSNRIVYRIA
jgi:hypothetical protein